MLTTVVGALAVTAVLAYVLADRREEFATALRAAPVGILVAATALQLVALVARTEAWRTCVAAAGATVGRRRLYRAASMGYVGSHLNSHVGTAARIGALRRAAPDQCPRVPALVAAEVPILTVEAALAALASFTLVGPLGLPWWLPGVFLAAAALLAIALGKVASRWRSGFWSGLATGALAYAGWAAADRFWTLRTAARRRSGHARTAAAPAGERLHAHVTSKPQPAIGVAP